MCSASLTSSQSRTSWPKRTLNLGDYEFLEYEEWSASSSVVCRGLVLKRPRASKKLGSTCGYLRPVSRLAGPARNLFRGHLQGSGERRRLRRDDRETFRPFLFTMLLEPAISILTTALIRPHCPDEQRQIRAGQYVHGMSPMVKSS